MIIRFIEIDFDHYGESEKIWKVDSWSAFKERFILTYSDGTEAGLVDYDEIYLTKSGSKRAFMQEGNIGLIAWEELTEEEVIVKRNKDLLNYLTNKK